MIRNARAQTKEVSALVFFCISNYKVINIYRMITNEKKNFSELGKCFSFKNAFLSKIFRTMKKEWRN